MGKETSIINSEDRKIWWLSYKWTFSTFISAVLKVTFSTLLNFLNGWGLDRISGHLKMAKCCYMAGSDKNIEKF